MDPVATNLRGIVALFLIVFGAAGPLTVAKAFVDRAGAWIVAFVLCAIFSVVAFHVAARDASFAGFPLVPGGCLLLAVAADEARNGFRNSRHERELGARPVAPAPKP
jgi:hypothetical protein